MINEKRYLNKCPCGSNSPFKRCCKNKNLEEIFNIPEGKEPEKLPDWRIEAITQLARDVPAVYPGGPEHEKGAFVIMAKEENHSQMGSSSFLAPHATALALSSALRNAKKGIDIKRELKEFKISSNGKDKIFWEPTDKLFDYFEFSMTTITSSIRALESYSNFVIGRVKDIKSIELTDNEGNPLTSKEEIENHCSIAYKLGNILPKILKIENIKASIEWNYFTFLKKMRNEIIHLKSSSMRPMIDNEEFPLYLNMLYFNPIVFVKISFTLIWKYSQSNENGFFQPPWARLFLIQLGNELESLSKTPPRFKGEK